MSGQMKHVAFDAKDARVVRPANTRRILRDHVQHWLDIRRRAGDYAQDFTRGSLLLQRLFEFVEQPNVLDGDHRLVGEGLEELDLRRGEGAHLDATCAQSTNKFSLADEGARPKRCGSCRRALTWNLILRADVGNVERAVLEHPVKLWFINTYLDAAQLVWNQNGPAAIIVSLRGVAASRPRSHKPARRSRRWRRGPAARPWASG